MKNINEQNEIAKNLTPDEVKAMDYLNDKFQMLAGDIHMAYNEYFHDYKPEPAGLYRVWLNKFTFDSDSQKMNEVGERMLARAIKRNPARHSIFDAETVLYDVLDQINDYYRAYWQKENA